MVLEAYGQFRPSAHEVIRFGEVIDDDTFRAGLM